MKHRDFHNAEEGAANIARFLGWLAALPLAGEIKRQLTACADWLHTLSRNIRHWRHQMGIYADKIGALESAVGGLVAERDHLKSQLADAQTNQADTADKTAADGVDAFLANLTPADTTASGTAPDTTPGAAGGTT
jgi:hypothetical protein